MAGVFFEIAAAIFIKGCCKELLGLIAKIAPTELLALAYFDISSIIEI